MKHHKIMQQLKNHKGLHSLKSKIEKEYGFTLFEVMATISLFALMTTVLIASYPDSTSKVELANAVSDVQGVVRDSQLKAGAIETSSDPAGGYGLYFDAASTSSFIQFKDLAIANPDPTQLIGNNTYDGESEIAKVVTIPEGFSLRNICVGNSSARPFDPSFCSRTTPSLGTITVAYSRTSAAPLIYINSDQNTKYASACIEFASQKASLVAQGGVRNMIISQSGFASATIGACDEAPQSLALNTSNGTYNSGVITSGATITSSNKTQPPVITLTGGDIVDVFVGNPYVDQGATALDGRGENITPRIKSNVVSFSSTTTEPVTTTFAKVGAVPASMIADASGNLYVSNFEDNTISRVATDGTVQSNGSTGASGGRSLLVDAAQNVYVSTTNGSYAPGHLVRIPNGGSPNLLAKTGFFPYASTITSNGDIYTANSMDGTVSKMKSVGGAVTSYTVKDANYSGGPFFITSDNSGNVYVSSLDATANGSVIKKIATNGTVSLFTTTAYPVEKMQTDNFGNVYLLVGYYYNGSGVTTTLVKVDQAGNKTTWNLTGSPSTLVIDSVGKSTAGGYLFVSDEDNNTITRVDKSGNSTFFATTDSYPTSMVIDSQDNLYTFNFTGNSVTKVTKTKLVTTPKSNVLAGGEYIQDMTTDGTDLFILSDKDKVLKLATSNNQLTTLAGNLGANITTGLALDSMGNLFVGNARGVTKIAVGNIATLFVTSYSTQNLAVDAFDNIYMTTNDPTKAIAKVTSGGGISSYASFSSQSSNWMKTGTALYVDPSSNLFMATAFSTNGLGVMKITSAGATSSVAISGGSDTSASPLILKDASGNFITTSSGVLVKTPNTVTATSSILSRIPLNSGGMAQDPSGNIYVNSCDYYANGVLSKTTPAGVTTILGRTGKSSMENQTISSTYTCHIVRDSSGNFFVVSPVDGTILKVKPPENLVDTISTITANSIDTTKVGNFAVVYSVSDDYGNTVTKTRIVRVMNPKIVEKIVTNANNTFTSRPMMTRDKQGNIYQISGTIINKITPQGNVSVVTNPGTTPIAIVSDVSGNIFIANRNKKIAVIPASGASTFTITVPNRPLDMVADTLGNVYTLNYDISGGISKFDATGFITTFGSASTTSDNNLAIDSNGDAYFSVPSDGLYKVNHSGGALTKLWSGTNSIQSVVTDSQNNIYITPSDGLTTTTILKITPSGTVSTFADISNDRLKVSVLGTANIWRTYIDSYDNIYVANYAYGDYFKFTPDGKKYLFPGDASYGVMLSGYDKDGNLYAITNNSFLVFQIK